MPAHAYLVAALLTLTAFARSATAQIAPRTDAPFTSAVQVSYYIKYYYINPNPDRIGRALDFISASANTVDDPIALRPAHAALGALLRSDPERIEDWVAQTIARDDPLRVLFAANCLWWSDTAEGDALVERLAAIAPDELASDYRILLETRPPIVGQQTPTRGLDMDILWSTYYATGDTAYAAAFFPLLPGYTAENLDRKALDRTNLYEAAVWSVASNAYQHPPLLEYLRTQSAENDDPALQTALSHIVASVDARIETDGPPVIPELTRRVNTGSPVRVR